MIKSIWSTPEAEAWARNFRYEDYLRIHETMCLSANPVSEQMYRELCFVFEQEMCRDIGG
jgi:hypothetical protein